MKYLYTGPSWAEKSFDSSDTVQPTNLSKEWGFDCVNLSRSGDSVLRCIESIKENKLSLPIIWVYNEPSWDLTAITNLTLEQFIKREDWREIREECNQYCLNQINSLNVPVLLIGGHSDIINCNFPNIQIGHASWQTWLAEQSGMEVDGTKIKVEPDDGGSYILQNCWGAEAVHQCIHAGRAEPVPSLLDSIWDMFYFWKELEKRNWFFEVHPNKRGNIEFAKFLKPVVENFLSTT